MKVSVVIPNYNYGRFLEATVGSVLSQTYPAHEIIVVDNGSTDDSREHISRLKDPRVKAVFHENRGQAGGRNTGVRSATGDLIAFLDADDIWLPEKLEKEVMLFRSPDVVLVYCGMRIVDGDLRPTADPDVLPRCRGRILEKFAGVASPVCGGESTAVVRASTLRDAGEFDNSLSIGTGWDMWRRIAARGVVEFVPEALVLYRQHGSNLSRKLDIYAHDTELKLQRMFADPTSAGIRHLRRKALGAHRMALAGAFARAGRFGGAVYWGIRAVSAYPAAFWRAAGWPARMFGLAGRDGG